MKYYLQLYIHTVLAAGWPWGRLNLEQNEYQAYFMRYRAAGA
jgi:hypothetical protein